jgi:hypothetical protein
MLRRRIRHFAEEAQQRLLNACQSSRTPWLYTVVVLALSPGARKPVRRTAPAERQAIRNHLEQKDHA